MSFDFTLFNRVNPGILNKKYKEREVNCGRVNTPYAVRLDGVLFSKRLEGYGVRDRRVNDALVEATLTAMRLLGADIGFTSSDEVSLVFIRNNPYSGRVAKVTSISAGIVSASVATSLGKLLYFDSRIIDLENYEEIIEYIVYRMRVTGGNFLTSTYRRLTGKKKIPPIEEVIRTVGTSFKSWKVFGTCLIPVEQHVEKMNPVSGKPVRVVRRRTARISSYKGCIRLLKDYLAGITA